jgi:hypothetical protein
LGQVTASAFLHPSNPAIKSMSFEDLPDAIDVVSYVISDKFCNKKNFLDLSDFN